MSAETIVYGYICLEPSLRKHNEDVLKRWSFDELYPFPNLYSDIRTGYGGDIVSFAGSLKSLDEDWAEWEERFETLLFQLYGRTARVHLEHETDGCIKSVGYLCREGWDPTITLPNRTWTRWNYGSEERMGEGVPVTRRR